MLDCPRARLSQARFQQRNTVVPDLFRGFLSPYGTIPDEIDWEADIEVIPDKEDPNAQMKVHDLSWEQALSYAGPDFRELVTDGFSDIYHERLDGAGTPGARDPCPGPLPGAAGWYGCSQKSVPCSEFTPRLQHIDYETILYV